VPHTSSQAFLRELDKKLWTAADKLRSNLDASEPVASVCDRRALEVPIGDIMVFGQDQWAWGAHLRRAQRARRVRLRRKQPNQSNPTTWRLAAMNIQWGHCSRINNFCQMEGLDPIEVSLKPIEIPPKSP
jgi:hypothetical protein